MDPLSLLTGVGVFITGWLVGRVTRRRREPDDPARPTCGCRHGLHAHDPRDGRCHGANRVKVYKAGAFDRYETAPCGCRQYVGPPNLELSPFAGLPNLPWPTPGADEKP